jgi:transmembrane sensor
MGRDAQPTVTREVAAEAAVWVARLHGQDRSPRMERECREWQSRSAAHRRAFERCTDTWQDVSGVTLTAYAGASSIGPERRRARRWFHVWVGAAAVACGLGGLAVLVMWPGGETYATGVGEQRTVVLPDGTRMSLNTASHVRAAFGQARRVIALDAGEALFEVAKDATRPFVVQAAGVDVVATGTSFVVGVASAEKAEDGLAVMLLEGQVVVRETAGDGAGTRLGDPLALKPGERLRVRRPGPATGASAALVDRPQVDQVLAWRRGEAVFDDVSLAEAVAEMNRYSVLPIVVPAALSGKRISGAFQTGDNTRFARAVAQLHGLVVREWQDRVGLAAP